MQKVACIAKLVLHGAFGTPIWGEGEIVGVIGGIIRQSGEVVGDQRW